MSTILKVENIKAHYGSIEALKLIRELYGNALVNDLQK